MSSTFVFHDRRDAGRILAGRLQGLGVDEPIVVALPRGGVPVGYEVARVLDAPLDIALVRKIGAPGQPELGIGALGEDGALILDRATIDALAVTQGEIEAILERETAELERRRRLYRGDRPALDVTGRTAILVDDGLATGVSAAAAAELLRARGATRTIVAVPVCPRGAERRLGDRLGEIVALEQPVRFGGVGAWYEDFTQTSDREVVALLRAARTRTAGDAGPRPPAPTPTGERTVRARDGAALPATLRSPARPRGVAIFVHGSGSSRRSPRNVAVARALDRRGLATLLFDLLTEDEASDRRNVFDIDLLSRRLADATAWVRRQPGLGRLPIGYFGASTGAAAALRAAAALSGTVAAVVSRGGRPDLARDALSQVTAPTLLIVGDRDRHVLALNEQAAELLAVCELAIVPDAGHLFEEPGALEEVARLAGDWFVRHLGRAGDARSPAATEPPADGGAGSAEGGVRPAESAAPPPSERDSA